MRKAKEYPEALWEEMKKEYVTSDISYRQLGTKNGVPFNQVRTRAIAEDWNKDRERFKNTVQDKTLLKIADMRAEESAKAYQIGCELLKKLSDSVKDVKVSDRKGIKSLTAAMRDMQAIGLFRFDTEEEQKEIRISFPDETEGYDE